MSGSRGEVVVVMDAFGAGGPRILDTDLAANLGMPTPANIRTNVITPKRTELESLGGFGARRHNFWRRGGRPGIAFCLNEEQALLTACRG